jgi:hypothetical protein
LITTIALLALVDTSVAIAQTARSPNPAAPPSTNPDNQLMLNSAPVENLRVPDCLVGDAVLIAPVSDQIPWYQEFYKEFCDLGA